MSVETIAYIKRLFDTLENTEPGSPKSEEAHRQLDELLFGVPPKHYCEFPVSIANKKERYGS